MANSKRKCTGCKQRFYQDLDTWRESPVGPFHNSDCQLAFAVRERDKQFNKRQSEKKKETKRKKKEFYENDSSHMKKKAQAAFNKFIRLRDKDKPCCTCGTTNNIQYHAGHYLSVGASPETRFNEINCHKQCVRCNTHLSGNVAQYRLFLVDKYGLQAVEKLEGPQQLKKHGPMALGVIEKWYKRKSKRLEL